MTARTLDFDARSAAASIGMPPLAAAGEQTLKAAHEAAASAWLTHGHETFEALADHLGELLTPLCTAATPAELGLSKGFIASRLGTVRGTPADLTSSLLQGFALMTLGRIIATADTGTEVGMQSHTVVASTPNGLTQGVIHLPALGTATSLTISVFTSGVGEAQGAFETTSGETLPWHLSGGLMGLPNPAAMEALGMDSRWARMAVGAAIARISD